MANYYDTLGVAKTASQDEIKKAYRKLAAKHHPDRGGDTKKFQEISVAYDTLSDPEKRNQYDNPNPFGGSGQGFQQYGGMPDGFEEIFKNFGFGDIFGRRPQQVKNRNLNLSTNITLEDAYHGKNLIADLNLPSGRQQTIEVKIPPGVRTGTTLRLAGVGDDSVSNIPRGDVHLTINIMPHPRFEREGDDLIMKVSITAFEAMLGKKITFESIGGKTLETNIPAGIQPGQNLNIHGHGMPNLSNPLMKGRLLINISVSIPATLTEDQKKIIKEFIQ